MYQDGVKSPPLGTYYGEDPTKLYRIPNKRISSITFKSGHDGDQYRLYEVALLSEQKVLYTAGRDLVAYPRPFRQHSFQELHLTQGE